MTTGTPTYAVGDIHGELEELQRVLGLIRADARRLGFSLPRVVFLGDYVDRGPGSRGVIDCLLALDDIDGIFLLGNHDLSMLYVLRDIGMGQVDRGLLKSWLDVGGLATIASYGVPTEGREMGYVLGDFMQVIPAEHISFLSRLQEAHHEGPWFFAHAGINPGRALEAQQAHDLVYGDQSMFEHDHEALAGVLRGRLGAVVVHGHYCSPTVTVWPHRIGIDTGCGTTEGGVLTAVALGDDGSVRVLGGGA